MYERLLFNIKNQLNQSKRSNKELNDKLHELFDLNESEFKKIQSIYGSNQIYKKREYEHNIVEQFKKSKYGDN